jgi:hypothetical protein
VAGWQRLIPNQSCNATHHRCPQPLNAGSLATSWLGSSRIGGGGADPLESVAFMGIRVSLALIVLLPLPAQADVIAADP